MAPNLKTKSLVFATFLANCVVIGLLIAAFSTEYLIVSTAKRHNTTESTGHIHMGLFSGSKQLNIAYGLRSYPIDVPKMIRDEPNVINYWYWLGTALGGGFGLFASAIGAVAAVIKTASPGKNHGVIVLLFISHIFAALSTILAFVCWLVHFIQHLSHNILIQEDLNNHWYTKDQARLGHSFYFLVFSSIIIIGNIILLILAVHWELTYRRRRHTEPPCDEKTQGAIMLY